MSIPASNRDDDKVSRLLRAFEEFSSSGIVTINCDQCGAPIEISKLADEVEEANCSCGKYKAVLKGL